MNNPFTRDEALDIWARLVAGWAHSLDAAGARALLDGVPNGADRGGSYEGVTRMLWGLGGWLSRPERPAVIRWRGEAFDLEQLTRRALVAGTDPAGRGWWGNEPGGEYDQRTVESGQVAFAAWQTRARIWDRLGDAARANVVAWLERFGRRPQAWRNNWALFWALNHAARKALGAPHDQATIDSALDYLDGVYCGDGWYDDAAARGGQHFDDYNLWVFATHVLAWSACDGHLEPERRARLLERVRLQMAHLPFFFAADGAYAEYGRSLSYKFARLGAPLMAYAQGCWPHSPGLLRRIVGRHLRWYLDRGAARADGTLRQSLTAAGSLAVRESYISTGATYWATLAFAGLWSLADDDPFWSADEELLPVERGDFARVVPRPGWLLTGTLGSGAVRRFNAGSTGGYHAKYDKFVYGSEAPFNVGLADGLPGPDSMLCLRDARGAIAHRAGNAQWAVGEAGWLRFRYSQQLGGTHWIDTTIVARGDAHVRAHRVALAPSAARIGALEGPPPLGYDPGDAPAVGEGEGWQWAAAGGRMVAIHAREGYSGSLRAAAWGGRADINSAYGEHLLPLLSVEAAQPRHDLICLVYSGPAGADLGALARSLAEAAWLPDGSFALRWADGEQLVVPPL